MITQSSSEENQLYGNRQLKKIYNRRPNREIVRPLANLNFREPIPPQPAPFNGHLNQPFSYPAMDHLTVAFDDAIQNLGMFLDTLTTPPTAPHSVEMGISGMNTVIVDYLNLLEACCVNHPILKNKILLIMQKHLALQNTGSLPVYQGKPLAWVPFQQSSRSVPGASSISPPVPPPIMPPGAPPMMPPAQGLQQHHPGFFGPMGMIPAPMHQAHHQQHQQNRPRTCQVMMDPNRSHQGFRMNGPGAFPDSTAEFFPTPCPSPPPPLSLHQNLLLNGEYHSGLSDPKRS